MTTQSSIRIVGLVVMEVALVGLAGARAAVLQGGLNVSGGKSVTASNEHYGAASNVTDGALGNGSTDEWLPDGSSGWVTVDLGNVYRLSDVNLLNSHNYNDRRTENYRIEVSTSGAFAGEQGTLATGVLAVKGSAPYQFQDVAMPVFGDPANNGVLEARYVRFNALTYPAGTFGPGLCEMLVNGVPDQAVGALASPVIHGTTLGVKAYTQTTALTDAAPASYTVRLVTITDPVSSVRSLGKTVTAGPVLQGDGTRIVNGANDGTGNEFLWTGAAASDLSLGIATLDLGEEMMIDRIDLLNTYNHNDRGTGKYIIRVGNDSAFADGNGHNILFGEFSALNESVSHVLGDPVLGRYVQFVASSVIGFSTGLDELTVYGRTVTSETIASGAGQLGGSSTWGAVELASPLPSGYHWLALDVTSPGGWSSLTLQQVFVPEPASLAVFAAVAVGLAVRRRSPVADRARGQACRGKGPRGA